MALMNVQNVYKVYYGLIAVIMVIFLAKLGWSIWKKGGLSDVKEAFQTYKVKPFDYYKTGADSMYFYQKNRYRKPYRYPYKFFKSYPTPHYSFLE